MLGIAFNAQKQKYGLPSNVWLAYIHIIAIVNKQSVVNCIACGKYIYFFSFLFTVQYNPHVNCLIVVIFYSFNFDLATCKDRFVLANHYLSTAIRLFIGYDTYL